MKANTFFTNISDKDKLKIFKLALSSTLNNIFNQRSCREAYPNKCYKCDICDNYKQLKRIWNYLDVLIEKLELQIKQNEKGKN